MAVSIGGFVNRILDKFLPDIVGDFVGAIVDGVCGNYGAAAFNLAEGVLEIVAYAGGEEAAAAGMEILEGIDISQHIENGLSKAGNAGAGSGAGLSAAPPMGSFDTMGGVSQPAGEYLFADDRGAYLSPEDQGAYF